MYNWNTQAFQLEILEDVVTEPVSVVEQKAFSHIDADYVANDSTLEVQIASAREMLEGALNVFLAVKKVEVWFQGNCLKLPYGPTGDIESVIKNGTDTLTTDQYTLQGLNFKTIITEGGTGVEQWFYPIYGGWPLPWVWTPGCHDFYNIIYETGYEVCPKALKLATMMLTDYMIKEQGTTEMEIPAAIMAIANRYSQNLIIQ